MLPKAVPSISMAVILVPSQDETLTPYPPLSRLTRRGGEGGKEAAQEGRPKLLFAVCTTTNVS
jgi:hypothetical protein